MFGLVWWFKIKYFEYFEVNCKFDMNNIWELMLQWEEEKYEKRVFLSPNNLSSTREKVTHKSTTHIVQYTLHIFEGIILITIFNQVIGW